MSNVHDLFTNKKDDDHDSDDENNRFVGGISDRGGGSGLAVHPNVDDASDPGAIFGRAEQGSSDDREQTRRTITMYRDGFVVDDGPYRRLDDPENADFLRALAMGRTPKELAEETGNTDVVVGLIDKRKEEYVEEFRSFSGTGTSLGTSQKQQNALHFDPTTLPAAPSSYDSSRTLTSIQVRLANGHRRVVRLPLDATVTDLASHLRDVGHAFRFVSGFPPKPLEDASATIEAAGLKGAQVSLQKAD